MTLPMRPEPEPRRPTGRGVSPIAAARLKRCGRCHHRNRSDDVAIERCPRRRSPQPARCLHTYSDPAEAEPRVRRRGARAAIHSLTHCRDLMAAQSARMLPFASGAIRPGEPDERVRMGDDWRCAVALFGAYTGPLYGGIIGAVIAAVGGAMASGYLLPSPGVPLHNPPGLSEALWPIPGSIVALLATYLYGAHRERVERGTHTG
jgi:hypothetical protein